MKATITKQTETYVELQVSVPAEKLEQVRKQTFDKLRPRVKAAGFRPGKAPDNVVERELGDAAIQSEALELAVTQSYAVAIQENKLPVLAPPTINLTKFVPYSELEYTAKVDVMPRVELADYKGIKLKRSVVTVDPKEVDQTIQDLRERMAIKTVIDRPAKMGDEVVIDFDGSRDGKAVDGASAKGHHLVLGSKSFIPGFEEELVGLAKGDKKEFDITFPKDYQATELAGQKVKFAIAMHEVQEVKLPEVDEKFVADISPFKTVEELRADIEARIKAEKSEQSEREFEDKVLEELVSKSKLAVPESLLEQQLARMRDELKQRLASSGLDMEKYLGVVNKTTQEIEDDMKPNAEKRVKLALILNAIAKAENITVTQKEIEDEVSHLRETYKDPQMQAELADPSILEDVHSHLLASRTIAKVLSYIES